MSFFQVTKRSSRSRARRGVIATDHGVVQTPAFVPVGTKATIKSLTPAQITDLKVQLSFVNTYHLVTHPGVEVLQQAGGVHEYAKLSVPLLSDSGGFQVFSLAQTNSRRAKLRGGEEEPLVLKINEDGVKFRSVYDGSVIDFTPESSMEFQRKIGADLLMAFDECTYYPATHEYAEKAMERTHAWLKRCLTYLDQHGNKSTYGHHQFLYGIIQGGTFDDLRVESAKFIATQLVQGVAIGGVAVGESKEEMRKQVEWVAPYLPEDKPVHLLGIGHIDDILDAVVCGVDTLDCVEPTRIARMGAVYQWTDVKRYLEGAREGTYEIDINKGMYKEDMSKIDEECTCYACINFSKSYLHHLFKQKELLGYTLASFHNLFTMERLMREVRVRIESSQY
ncbi:tRNA guanosine(34) transglycosylase Tgt [Candidatus Roizmanbacteria bacterium]|nr:tRNA guanosine(34) transglycosylase Tgt [Candidatus Roizmanbacteria bacterium]